MGFKSVFVCSDQPIIKSNHWQFQFRKSLETDELSYITPHYLDDSLFPEELKNAQIESNEAYNTFIHLKLKEKYSKQDYFEDLEHKIQLILLFTINLEEIIIENKLKDIKTVLKSSKHENKMIDSIEIMSSKFDEITFKKCLISIEREMQQENISMNLFECKLAIPDDYVNDESLKTNKAVLTIGFPCDVIADKTYPVFEFLPIYNQGFKFVINTYWSLTTNRESKYQIKLIS